MKKSILILTMAFGMNAMAQVPSYVPTNGLVAYYGFNGNANDASGNVNNGTVNGATLTTDRFGNANSAYNFNGTSDYISCSSSPITSDNIFSISAWVYSNVSNANMPFITLGDKQAWTLNELTFGILGDKLTMHTNGMNDLTSNAATLTANKWVHVVVVHNATGYNTSSFKFYINATEYTNNTKGGTNVPFPMNNSIAIGRMDGAGPGFMNGKIDDIAIYNRALTQTEITQLYRDCNLTAAITPQSTTTFCAGDFVTLNANTGTNYTYKWYNNGNIINNAISSSYSATQSGNYIVTIDSLGCSDTSSAVVVTVNSSPTVTIASLPSYINYNASAVAITGNPTGGTFSGNGVSGNSFTPKNAGLGTKQITYIYTDGNACSNSASTSAIVYDTTGIVCTSYDTITTTINDTVIVTVSDTNYVSVTDTLIINAILSGIAPPNNINTLKVFPNPTNDKLFINTGNYAVMNNYTIKITTMLGQEVFNTKVTQQEFVIDLNTFGNKGVYFFELYDGNNNKIEARKIILQ